MTLRPAIVFSNKLIHFSLIANMILNKNLSPPSLFHLFSPPQHFFYPFRNISNNISTTTLLLLLLPSSSSSCYSLIATMRRRPRTTLLLFLLAILLFATFSLHISRHAVSTYPDHLTTNNFLKQVVHHRNSNHHEDDNIVSDFSLSHQTRRVSSVTSNDEEEDSLSTVSILLPDWEILLIVSPNMPLSSISDDDQYNCLFRNNVVSPAKFSGVIPFTNMTTFKCDMPESVRRRKIFSQPMLVTGPSDNKSPDTSPEMELMRWNFLVYESFSTDDDVVLLAKGVNHRQGYDRSPNELRCVFSNIEEEEGGRRSIINTVTSSVTHSVQEVFRCPHPNPSELGLLLSDKRNQRIKVSLEIIGENLVVPSVAYYSPPRPNSLREVEAQPKYFLCACTMVFNVAKFLREWVMYHSKVGIENFILYDNNSDDDLEGVVNELREEGYNITTVLWIWPKTQEAGFSHSILYSKSKGLCTWMMYADVDEFVYSPAWGGMISSSISVRNNGTNIDHHGSRSRFNKHNDNRYYFPSLKSMLPSGQQYHHTTSKIGQVSMRCLEFGPSGQREHPVEGVTQGYTCRRRGEQRHKSIVLVDAVDKSLRNVIHHFEVNEKEGFRSKQLGVGEGLVNHYKYQAWDEFKSKFRRRVSAYVVDWRQAVNPNSKDRTPGLGFEAVEPKDWSQRFCEVNDLRLKSLTQAWFGYSTPNGYRMAWQSS